MVAVPSMTGVVDDAVGMLLVKAYGDNNVVNPAPDKRPIFADSVGKRTGGWRGCPIGAELMPLALVAQQAPHQSRSHGHYRKCS